MQTRLLHYSIGQYSASSDSRVMLLALQARNMTVGEAQQLVERKRQELAEAEAVLESRQQELAAAVVGLPSATQFAGTPPRDGAEGCMLLVMCGAAGT